MFLLKFQKYLFFQCFQEKLIRIAAAIAPQYVSIFTRVPPCNIEKNKIFQKHFILMEQVALIKCIMFLLKFQKYLFFQCFQEKLIRIAAVIAPQYVSIFTRVPPCNIEKNKIFQKHFILMEQVALITCMMFLLKFQKYLFFQCFQEKLIRIAAAIAPQYVLILTRVPPCNIEKNKKILETLYIDGIGSPDEVHYVSIKILEIHLLLVFLGEVDTYFSNDSAPQNVSIFTRVPPCNIEKKIKFYRNTFILMEQVSPDQVHYVSIKNYRNNSSFSVFRRN